MQKPLCSKCGKRHYGFQFCKEPGPVGNPQPETVQPVAPASPVIEQAELKVVEEPKPARKTGFRYPRIGSQYGFQSGVPYSRNRAKTTYTKEVPK